MPTYKIIELGLVAMELLACVVGIFCWKKLRSSYLKWLVIYLGAIVLSEVAGLLLLYKFGMGELSRSFYNYFVIPLEFLFFCWLYYQYFKNNRRRYWPICGAAVYTASWLINLLFLRELNFWSLPFSYMAGVIVLLSLAILFFNSLLTGNEILWYKQNAMFWISLGILTFYLVSSPFFGLRRLLFNRYQQIFWVYYYLAFAVNYFMYILFSIAILWGKPR